MAYPALQTITARYATRPLAPAAPPGVTASAPTTMTALAVRVGKSTRDRIWGALPTEEVEGHSVDPAYDVRPIEGLGRAPIRSERIGLGISREIMEQIDEWRDQAREQRILARPSGVVDAANQSSQPELDRAVASAFASSSSSTSSLLPIALAAVAAILLLRR